MPDLSSQSLPQSPTLPFLGGGVASGSRRTLLTVIGLIAAVLCAYAMVGQADFIHFDDNNHVFENPTVKAGLTKASVVEAFRPHASLWVPLATLSFMADVSLFGMNPGAMHLVNLLWHTATVVLLFFTLRRMTGNYWASAFVAALFGLHPLNVESVAWVTERKNVLCAFFWVGSIAMYARYTERPRVAPYLASLGAAALALLAKPMAVTLPFTLLLMDGWPLRRLATVKWNRLLVEKLPFLALAGAVSLVAMASRTKSEVVTLETVTLAGRVSNALVSYATYLGDMFWPAGLGVFYPHPVAPQPFLASLAAVLLIGITAVAWFARKRCPFLLVGWLWFLGTLVPMIGLVQAGSQARADRFTYIAQLGIFIAVTGLVAEILPRSARMIAAVSGIFLLACGILTARQVSFWMDGATLFEHTIEVTGPNACARANAGLNRAREGDLRKAIEHFRESLRILPDQGMIWRELGKSLLLLEKPQQAVGVFRAGLKFEPEDYEMRYQLAIALRESKATSEAIRALQELLDAVPHSAGLHYNMGLALADAGKIEEAKLHLTEAAARAPTDARIKEAIDRLGR